MRTRSVWVLALLCVAAVRAQESQTSPKCSLSGSVEDSVSQQPLDGFEVMLSPGQKPVTTDAKGNFQFKDLDAGTYRLAARAQRQVSRRTSVSLTCAQDVSGVRLKVDPDGAISGRVLDENGEPVVNAEVDLVARDYFLGKIRYTFTSTTHTNDKGEYSLSGIHPGYRYFLYANRIDRKLPAISTVPANPKLRKKVFEPEYFGGADAPEGAQAVVVQAGEHKEGFDFKLRRTEAWCVDGVLEPGRAQLYLDRGQPHSGFSPSAEGGTWKIGAWGQTGDDGKFRICNLPRGDYSLITVAFSPEDSTPVVPLKFSVTEVSITDHDIHDLKIAARPRIPIQGEVVLDGPAPEQPVSGQIQLLLHPIGRAGWQGEDWFDSKSQIPGEFSFPGLFVDQYRIRIIGVPKDFYLKEASYAGNSVLSTPIVPGSVGNASMRIVLARDGGTIQVKVVDKDKNGMPDASLVAFPAEIGSPALLASSMIRGSTDQNGNYTSDRLAPGKYLVIAIDSTIDYSADCIEKLWALRNKVDAVELAPNGSLSLALELTVIQ